MWSRVTGIAGKGVHKAVEAASFVGEVIAPNTSHDFDHGEDVSSPSAQQSTFTQHREVARVGHDPLEEPGETTRAVRIWEDDDVIMPSRNGWREGRLSVGRRQDSGSPIKETSRVLEALSTEATRGEEYSKAPSEVRDPLVGDASHAYEGGKEEPVLKPTLSETSSASSRHFRSSEGGERGDSQPSSGYNAPAADADAADYDGSDFEIDNIAAFGDKNVGNGLGSREHSYRTSDSGGELGGTDCAVQMGPVEVEVGVDVIQSVVEDAGESPVELEATIAQLHREAAPRNGPSNQELQEDVRRLTRELEESRRREVELVKETRQALSQELEECRSRAAETVENVHRGLTQELEEVRSRETKAVEESRRLTLVNSQLKQIIDQMREVSRSHSEETKLLSGELGDTVKAKEAADLEATMARRQVSELQELLEQALHRTDRQSCSAQEKDMVLQELKQAQEEATKDRLKEEELSAKLVSLQGMYQTALQQQQQLRSRENALTADLALATQDKARLESALGNMRGVLEEFGAEKHTEVKIIEARLKEEIASREQEFETAKMELKRMHEEEVSKCKQAAEEALQAERRLRVRAQVESARASRDVQRSRGALDDALSKMQGTEDGNIDRQFVKNLIVRYVTSHHKKQVLDLMARMFSFSEEDKEMVGLTRRSLPSIPGMLTAMFKPPQEDLKIPAEDVAGRPLSDLWMDFLMSETAEEDESK